MMRVLHKIVEDSGYEAWIYQEHDSKLKAQRSMQTVFELIDWIVRLQDKDPKKTLSDCINMLMLIDRLDNDDENNDACVQLMTAHASKGLEFPFVYLVGMEEGLLPHQNSIDTDNIEEERRLAYVGITRAQWELTMSLTRSRKRAGEWMRCQPSRFLEELPEEHVTWIGKRQHSDKERNNTAAQSHLANLKSMLQ